MIKVMGNNRANETAYMLKRRGFKILSSDPVENLILPGIDKNSDDDIYGMLKKYSFRIFIRDAIKNRRSFSKDGLMRYSTAEWVQRYIDFLIEKGIAEAIGGSNYRLKQQGVSSFGDTLEWLMAKIFEKEFGCPAMWGVKLAGLPAGGDYDVLACVEGGLVYVEVKSSPPKNVEIAEVRAFLSRAQALKPSMAIFFEDTQLRMFDKIVPLFEEALEGRDFKITRLQGELFAVNDLLYIMNSDPDMVTNLNACLGRHLARKKFL